MEKDQVNFIKLAVKGFKAMAKDTASFKNKDLYKLSKKASMIGNKGFEAFQSWFQSLDNGDKLVLAGELAYYTKQKDKTIEKMLKFKFENKESIKVKSFKEQQGLDEGAYVADYNTIIKFILKDVDDVMKKAFKSGNLELVNNIARFAKHRVTTKGQAKGKLFLYGRSKK